MNKIKDKIDPIEYISLKDASKLCSYSQDYLSLRARQGKLKAVKIGRNWMTTKEWLNQYINKVNDYTKQVNNKKSVSESVSKKIKKDGILKKMPDFSSFTESALNKAEKYIGTSIDKALISYNKFVIRINKAIGDVCSQLAFYNKRIKIPVKQIDSKFVISAVLISLIILSSFFAFNPQARASIANLGEGIAGFVFNTGQNIVLLAQNTKKSAGNLFDNIIVKSPQLIEESTDSIKAISSKTNSNIQDKSISLSKAISNKTSESIQSVPKNTTNLIKGLYENIDKLVASLNKAPEKILKFASSANKENENLKLTIKYKTKNISERIIQIPSKIEKLPNKAIYVFANINQKNEDAKLLVVDKN